MIKKYLLKLVVLSVMLSGVFTKTSAQYAIGGTAGTTLANSVYWLTWDNGVIGSTLITTPVGYDAYHIVNGTYVWQFSPTVQITAIISNEVVTGGAMQAYTPGSYSTDGLDLIYSGNNAPKPGSQGVLNSALSTAAGGGGTATFDIDIKVAILINGVYTDVVYPGMVIGDAESIATPEYIKADSPNPIGWQLLNKRTNGAANDNLYKMDLSNSGKSFKLHADAPGNLGVQAVMFAHGARNLKNVSIHGEGVTAIAIGFILPFDLGDGPLSYGITGHYMDQFQITDNIQADGTYPIVNYNTTPLIPQATVYMGANNVDPDGQPVSGILATNDDLTGNNDESSIVPSALPDIKVNQAGDVVLTVPVTNTKGVPATLRGWIDFNRDGLFSANEEAEVTIPANTANQNFTLTFLNATFASKVKVGTLYTRLRVTTTNLVDDPATSTVDERSASFAADGEAEDYKLKDILGVTISGTVFDDANGGLDALISGTGLQSVSGSQLYAYLVNSANTIVNKSTLGVAGTYSFTNTNNGTYKVAISTNNVAIGGTLASVAANLPAGWKPSGADYGQNNAGNTGIQVGVPNLQIPVATPGTSLDVTNVNFGINQVPVTVADAAITTIGQAVAINVPANDSDPDGTLNLTTVLLIDPADNGKKTSVTIAGKGTYTVNTTTGVVTFTPVATFIGKTVPLAYTIKDNFGSESASALISVNVKPVGVNDVDATLVNIPAVTVVKLNDGPSGIGTTVTPTNGTHGTTTADLSGKVTYTPALNYIGVDTYTYTLTTSDGVVSDPITVTITIGSKLTGNPDFTTTPINTPVTTTVAANDGSSGVGATVTPTNGTHGTTTVDVTGNVTYTPVATYVGKDIYTYTLSKSGSTSDPINVTVSIKPVGVNDATTTPINTPVTTTVTANDGPSGVGTTVTPSNGLNGTTVVDATGKVTYTPNNGFIGKDTYTYTLTTTDGVVSDPITVTVSVKPVGVNDVDVTAIATPVTTTVKSNDGPSGIATTVAPTNGTHGTTNVDVTGKVTYTPAAGYIGIDTYTYTLTTADGVTSDPITVTISIKPAGVPDATTTPINTPVTTTVTANDGPSGIGATLTPSNGTHGTTTVDATGKVTYTPAAGYIGKDTYTYTLTNGGATSDPIMVTVSIKPVGVNDADITPISTPVTTTVKNNDGPSGIGTTVTATSGVHGTTSVDGTGRVTYTPVAGYIGTDTYTYTLTTTDGVVSTPIIVTISIKPVGVNDADVTPINTPVTTVVTANDGPSGVGAVVTPTFGAHGATTVDATGKVTYTPVNNYIGKDNYTYTLTNGGAISSPITVTISIKPVGVNDIDATIVNIPVTTTVTANDGPSGIGTTVTPTNGTHGTTTVDASGKVTYTPAAGYVGIDTYTYTLTTTDGVVSDPITVTITINNKPTGVPDITTTPINTPVTTIVTANDGSSGIGATVTPTNGSHGTTTVDATGKVTFTPVTDYIGKDIYTYTLTKSGAISDPVTVTVSIKPVGVNDADVTPINIPVTTTVKANDGPSGIGTTVTPTNGTHGTTTVDVTGKVTYTPASGYVGTDTYTYTLTTTDGVVSDPITVTISIQPIGVNDADVTPINTPVTTTVTANDGPSGVGAIVTPTNGTHGTTTVDATGKVTYTPAAGYTGKDTYTYTLTTGGVISAPITVTISVKPVGVPDIDVTPINTPVTTTVKTNDGPSGTGTKVASTNGIHGTTTVDGTGKVTYTPVAGYIGTDIYTYTLTTPDGVVSDPVTVTISIKPAGVNDVITTGINTPVITTVTANDGPSGVGATVTPTNGLHGTTTVDAAGNVTYTPATDYSGKDTYTYTLTNGGATSDPITVTVTIIPIGVNDADITPVNTPVTTTVTANDGASGIGTTVTPTNGTHGTTTVDASGRVIYIPTASYVGIDTYTYTLTTKDGIVSAPITVKITIYSSALGLTKAANNGGVKVGDVINYTIVVTNSGTTLLSNVAVTDAGADAGSILPALIANMAPGSSVTVSAKHTLTPVDISNGSFSNQASVTATDQYGQPVTKPKSDDPTTPTIDDPTVVLIVLPKLKIPNLFTPNGDGINDVFEVRGLEQFLKNELTIVNRWGNEVYKKSPYKNNWAGDGLNEGTYYYILKVRNSDTDEWTIYKGYVTLIRAFKQ